MVFGMGGGQNEIEVVVSSDTRGFVSGIDDAIGSVNSFKGAVAGMSAVVSAGAVVAMKAAVGHARELSAVNRDLLRTMPTAEAEAMTQAVADMGSTIPMTTSELGNIAAQASQFGVKGVENIDTFTRAVAKMAASTDLTSQTAGKAFAQMANQMDIPMSEAENLGSAINDLSNNMAASSSEIVRATSKSAASLTALGMTHTDIVGLNAALVDAGMQASNAGRGMRRLQQSMSDPTKAAAMAGALGMTTDEFKSMRNNDPTGLILHMAKVMRDGGDAAEKLGGVTSSFSQKTLTMLASNLDGANDALGRSADAYRENTSLQAEFETQTDSLGARIQILRNEVGSTLAVIGKHFTPVLRTAVDAVIDGVRVFGKFNEATDGAAGAIALVAAAVGGAIPPLMLLSSVIGPLTPLVLGMGAAMLTVVGIIGTVGAAIAGLAAMWKSNFGGIQTSTSIVMGEVRRQFGETLPMVRTLVSTVLSDIQSMWSSHGQRVENTVGEYIGRVTTFLAEGLMGLGRRVRSALADMLSFWKRHRQQVAAAIQALGPVLLAFAQGVIQKFKLAIEGAVMLGTRLWKLFGDRITQGANRIGVAIQRVMTWWNNLDSTHRNMLKGVAVVIAALLRILNPISFVITAIAGLAAAWKTNFAGIRDTTNRTVGEVMARVQELRARIQQSLDRLLELWQQHGQQVVSNVRAEFGKLIPQVAETLGAVLQVVTGLLGQVVAAFEQNVDNISRTVAAGMFAVRQTVNTVLPAVLQITTNILSAVEGLWRDNSAQIQSIVRNGLSLVIGIVTSMLNVLLATWAMNADEIIGTITRLANTLIEMFRTFMTIIIQISEPILARLNAFWQTHAEDIELIVATLATIVIRIVTTLMNMLVSIIQTALAVIQFVWRRWGDEITTVVSFVMDVVLSVVGAAIDTLATIIRAALALIEGDWRSALTEIWGLVKRIFGGILTFITSWGGRLLAYIVGLLADLFNAFLDWANALIFGSLIKDMFNEIFDFITGTLADLLGAVTDSLGSIKDTISEKLSAAKDAAIGAVESMKSGVVRVLGDIVSAFSSKLSRVRRIASRIVSTARNASRRARSALSSARSRASRAASAASRAAGRAKSLVGLQHGGIVTSPMTARIGEQGPEAVIPMNRLDRMVTQSMGQAMQQHGGGGGGGPQKTVVVENLYTQASTRAQARQVKDELADALDAENIR